MSVWSQLKFFNESEAWGDPSKISPRLLTTLDSFRGYLGCRMTVTSGTQGVHTDGSAHYRGEAVDVVVTLRALGKDNANHLTNIVKPLDVLLAAMRFDFGGIGLYPDWKLQKAKDNDQYLGLHLDVRQHERKSLWIGKRIRPGKTDYFPVEWSSLSSFNLL